MNKSLLISILIPTYNGEEFFRETLDSIVSQINDKVELVVCDDCSKDNTFAIAQEYANNYPQIKLYKNEKNLGMDGNFEKVASHATGKYIWYSGQDDLFGEEAVNKVVETLETNSVIDFVYMNFSRHSHDLSELILEKHLDIEQDILCKDYREFLQITTLGQLPSFLPSFIMRKSLFDKAEKQRFSGTQFIQLGAFFSVLKDLSLYIIATPYIKGRVPGNRWQNDSVKLLDVLSGDFEVIKYAYDNYKVIDSPLYRAHYKKVRKWLLNTLILTKKEGRKLDSKITKRFKFIFNVKDYFISKFILSFPDVFFRNSLFLKLVKLLR